MENHGHRGAICLHTGDLYTRSRSLGGSCSGCGGQTVSRGGVCSAVQLLLQAVLPAIDRLLQPAASCYCFDRAPGPPLLWLELT